MTDEVQVACVVLPCGIDLLGELVAFQELAFWVVVDIILGVGRV